LTTPTNDATSTASTGPLVFLLSCTASRASSPQFSPPPLRDDLHHRETEGNGVCTACTSLQFRDSTIDQLDCPLLAQRRDAEVVEREVVDPDVLSPQVVRSGQPFR